MTFRHPIAIAESDIDFMGHVNNAVYLRWVQESVIAYWQKVAPADAVAGHLWVALKHEISYRRPAFVKDVVVADVVSDGMKGARAFFRTVVRRGEDILAEVTSSWCCIDAVTKRPARLARDIVARFVEPAPPS